MALVFEAKAALFEQLKGSLPGDTQCTFADPGEPARRKAVWLGATTDDDMAAVAMRDGPRKPTTVTGFVHVHAVVISPGDPIDAERSVYGLRDGITEACSLLDRATVPGLIDMRPESATVETSESPDGVFSALTLRVRVRGRVYQ